MVYVDDLRERCTHYINVCKETVAKIEAKIEARLTYSSTSAVERLNMIKFWLDVNLQETSIKYFEDSIEMLESMNEQLWELLDYYMPPAGYVYAPYIPLKTI